MFTTSQLLPITLVHYPSDHQPYSELSSTGHRLVITINIITQKFGLAYNQRIFLVKTQASVHEQGRETREAPQ